MFLATAFVMFLFLDSLKGNTTEATGLVVSEESFPTYLETHPAIEGMPDSSLVELNIGDNTYEIEGQHVYLTQSEGEKDLKITLPSGYEEIIGQIGLCNAVKKANENNELGVELHASKATILFKYRKLLKYGECLNG